MFCRGARSLNSSALRKSGPTSPLRRTIPQLLKTLSMPGTSFLLELPADFYFYFDVFWYIYSDFRRCWAFMPIHAYLLALRETTHFRLVYKMIKDFDNDNMRPRSYVALCSYTAIQSYAPLSHRMPTSSFFSDVFHAFPSRSAQKIAKELRQGIEVFKGLFPFLKCFANAAWWRYCERLFCKARKIDATPSLGDMALFDLQFRLFEEKARKNTCLGCAWTILNTTCLHTKL